MTIRHKEACSVCGIVIDDFILKDERFYCHECIDYTYIKGFNQLDQRMKNVFAKTYPLHYKAQGTKRREQFTLDKIRKVKYNPTELCIEVYYIDDWYKYHIGNTWS